MIPFTLITFKHLITVSEQTLFCNTRMNYFWTNAILWRMIELFSNTKHLFSNKRYFLIYDWTIFKLRLFYDIYHRTNFENKTSIFEQTLFFNIWSNYFRHTVSECSNGSWQIKRATFLNWWKMSSFDFDTVIKICIHVNCDFVTFFFV